MNNNFEPPDIGAIPEESRGVVVCVSDSHTAEYLRMVDLKTLDIIVASEEELFEESFQKGLELLGNGVDLRIDPKLFEFEVYNSTEVNRNSEPYYRRFEKRRKY